MKMRTHFCILILLGCALSMTARAQDAAAATGVPKEGNVSVQEKEESAPAGRQTIFGESFGKRLNFVAEGSYQGEYDDNVFSSSALRLGDWNNHLSGRLTTTMQRKHFSLEAHYLPDYRLYQTYSSRDALSQQFAITTNMAHTARTSTQFNGHVSDATSNSLPQFSLVSQGGVLVPVFGPGPLEQNARVLTSFGSFTVHHRNSAKTSWSGSIHGGTTNYLDTPLTTGSRQDTYSTGGDLTWSYSQSRGKTYSVEIGHDYFGFSSPSEHQNYDFAKARFEVTLPHQWTARMGAGPSFRKGGTDPDVHTSYAVDAGLTHKAKRVDVGLAYTHGNSLSSLRGALTSSNASAFATFRILPKWTMTSSGAYTQSQQIAVQSLETQGYSASIQSSYAINRALSAFAQYNYVRQTSDLVSLSREFDRNLISFGLRYTFRPLEGF